MSAPALIAALRAELELVAHLKERCMSGPDAWARRVSTRAELAEVSEDMQIVPGVYVVYDGYTVLSSDAYAATLSHRWLVVLALSGAAASRAGTRTVEAGEALSRLIEALHGWSPPGCQPLLPQTPPRPWHGDGKFSYYPTLWTCDSTVCPG